VANLREPSTAFNRDLLVAARWFAGKERTVADVHAVSRLEPAGANGATVELVDVMYADGGTERYALALRDGRECAGDDPLWPALARAAGVAAVGGGRFLADDLSNTVVVLDDLHVLKLYRRPEPGTHPEVELLDALAGSPHAPSLEGALAHDGVTLASLQAYVCGEPVGWEPLIARLAGGGRAEGLPSRLARVTEALHRTLAERLGTTRDGLQRIHGDLHVGQFLDAGLTLVVVDWEGRPGLSPAERSEPRPAAADLASLRLSLAHAARAAHRRNPGFDWRAWSRAARHEALEAYGPVDRDLLLTLELEKELDELEYARRWLPEWLYVPTEVLPFVREGG
jgi:maltokinase